MVDDNNMIDTSKPSLMESTKNNIMLENNPSSILSLLSSITSKQAGLLNYIFTSEMMALESQMSKDGNTPIMDVYNAIWLAANLNIFNKAEYTSKMTQYLQNNTKAALESIKFFEDTNPMSYATKQQVISLINDNSMKYINKLGDDIKAELSKVVKDGVVNGSNANDVIRNMQNIYNMNAARARTIVRTETMRAANSAAYAQAVTEGKKYFIVDSRTEACIFCKREYLGKVFDITESSKMPPLHPNCACIPVFFNDKTEAYNMANGIEKQINTEVKLIEKKTGEPIPKDGTGSVTNK